MRILVVDDESSIATMLVTLLSSEGYDATPALSGKSAIHLLSTEEFDLMISDIRMTPMNGMELLKHAHEHCPRMSVIMLTAYGQVDTAIEAMELGAFDYIKKPFRADYLLSIVKKALDARVYLDESTVPEKRPPWPPLPTNNINESE